MNRRTFLCGLTAGTLYVPLAARAQQAAQVPRVGAASCAGRQERAQASTHHACAPEGVLPNSA